MNEILFKRTHLPVPAERAFQWHVEAGALEHLTPSWEEARVIAHVGRADQVGSRVTLSVKEGPFRRKWTAVHTACEPARMFRDEQVSGLRTALSRMVRMRVGSKTGLNISFR
jgi:ligand-binding SRPBCC domain-containing protein